MLLDEFIATVAREKEMAKIAQEREMAKKRITGVLDAITRQLTEFEDSDNLIERIDQIYERLDQDGSGGLDFGEFKDGIRRLPGISRIHMTEDDFEIITENGKHLGETGEFNKMQFRDMMRSELWRFSRRQLKNVLSESDSDEFKSTVLMLKMIETNILDRITAHVDDVVDKATDGLSRQIQDLSAVLTDSHGRQAPVGSVQSALNVENRVRDLNLRAEAQPQEGPSKVQSDALRKKDLEVLEFKVPSFRFCSVFVLFISLHVLSSSPPSTLVCLARTQYILELQ